MGLFKCSKCKCIENTALGLYSFRDMVDYFEWDEANIKFKGEPLCSECAPKAFSGTHEPTGYGKWHGKFIKRYIYNISEKDKSEIYNK